MKKLCTSLILLILLINILQIGIDDSFIIVTHAESGAPPINGTTNTTWYIELSDKIIRKNEIINTSDIQINSTGKMEWYNITANIDGNITVKPNGIFNFTNCTLIISGNLSINGSSTLRNTTILMNCTQNGTYHIEVQSAGEMYIYDYDNDTTTAFDRSNITSALNDGYHRFCFWIRKGAKFVMKNSELHECGYQTPDKYAGIYVQTNHTVFENCTISNNFNGLQFWRSSKNRIEYCKIFSNDVWGIYSYMTPNKTIEFCDIFNNGQDGIVLAGSSFTKIFKCNITFNSDYGIYLASLNNTIRFCNISSNYGIAGIVTFGGISGNIISNCELLFNYYAIYWRTSFMSANHNIIDNCNIKYNKVRGIYFDGFVYDNIISSCNISENQGYGIYFDTYCSYNNITNCNILSNRYGGISFRGYVNNNNINQCNISKNIVSGISFGSSSGSNIVNNCNITNNIFSGIRISSNDNIIFNNNIRNNSDDGITFTGNYPNNIIANCNISLNHRFGIYFVGSGIPEKTNNNIITNCHISMNNNRGINVKDASGIFFENNKIVSNNIGGVLAYKFYNSYFNNCSILSNNGIGLELNYDSNIKIVNSSIMDSTEYDIILEKNSDLIALNTTFNKTRINIGNLSRLTNQWYLHIKTVDETYISIPGANVSIQDNQNGTFIQNYTTDIDGFKRNIVCTEFIETNSSRKYYTPHQIEAIKNQVLKNNTELFIDRTKDIIIMLVDTTVPEKPDLIPLNISVSNTTPIKNQKIHINTTIINNGTSDIIQTSFSVRFYIDNILADQIFLISLDKNTAQFISFQWTVNVNPGQHIIKIVVDPTNRINELDEDNNQLTYEITINMVPIAVLEGTPNVVLTNENVMLDASNSEDEVLEIVAYYFEFGDGNASGWISDSSINHRYPENGIYFARLIVSDTVGVRSIWSDPINITVNNRNPSAEFNYTPSKGNVTTTFEFDPGSSFDPDGRIITYFWCFGDGTNSSKINPEHQFQDDKNYTVELIVQDDDGANSTIFSMLISVSNLPPVAEFVVNKTSAKLNDSILFNASLTTDSDDNNITELNYSWNFEDGSTSYGRIIVHRFDLAGIYNVTLTVSDDNLATDRFVMQIIINPPEKLEEPETDSTTEDDNISWIIMVSGIIIVIVLIIVIALIILSRKKPEELDDLEE